MRANLRSLWQRVLSLLPPHYYIVEFDIDGKGEHYQSYHAVKFFGGCPRTGVFPSYKEAYAYWEYRVSDNTDPGFSYRITKLDRSDELVLEYIRLQGEANGIS